MKSKVLMSVTVCGKEKTWSFNFYGDPKYLPEWWEDGLPIGVIENTIPVWVANLGMTRVWCFMQDVFNFRNPFRD